MSLIRLDEYCDSVRDGTHDTPKPTSEGKYLITSKAINNDCIDYSTAYYISEKDYNAVNKRSKVDKYDVIMTMIGSVGRLHFIDYEPDYAIKNIALFKVGDYYKAKWLYYYLSSNDVQNYLEAVANGTSQHFVGLGYLRKFKIENISESNKKIVDILTEYDNLIKLNNKRIKLLEQTAEEIFKEWFVRFRFPGYEDVEFKNSNLGKIPVDFDVVKMADVISDNIGGGWGEEEQSDGFPQDAYVIRGADFPSVSRGDMSTCPYRFHKQSNYNARQLKENDIVIEISGGTSEQPVGRTVLVTQYMLNKLDNKVICASFCKRLRLNQKVISPLYFYYWMQFLYDTRMIDRFQLQSTGIINFKFEYFLKKGDWLLPPKQLMKSFEDEVRPIRKRIDVLASENANLMKQRDYLLPRLMSGKLEV